MPSSRPDHRIPYRGYLVSVSEVARGHAISVEEPQTGRVVFRYRRSRIGELRMLSGTGTVDGLEQAIHEMCRMPAELRAKLAKDLEQERDDLLHPPPPPPPEPEPVPDDEQPGDEDPEEIEGPLQDVPPPAVPSSAATTVPAPADTKDPPPPPPAPTEPAAETFGPEPKPT